MKITTIAALALGFSLTLQADDETTSWNQFRGPNSNNTIAGSNPITWDALLKPPTWSVDIPGRGWASPIVVDDKIWLMSAEAVALEAAAAEAELAKQKEKFGNADYQNVERITLLATQVDAVSGTIDRTIRLKEIANPLAIHNWNSHASPTPATDGKRVYCHFGSLGTFAIDSKSGEVVWQRDFVIEEMTGPASSPILWDERLYMCCDGADKQYMLCLDAASGETLWQKDRPDLSHKPPDQRRSFGTPICAQSAGRWQLITVCACHTIAYDPISGEEIWRAKMADGFSIVPQPVFAEDVVYVCSGYMQPELFAIRTDGQGDVTQTHILWNYKKQVPTIPTPVYYKQRLFMVSTNGVCSCIDSASGEPIWSKRLDGEYCSSPLLVGDLIYFTNRSGLTTIIKASDTYEVIATSELPAETMASLVPIKRGILIRTDPKLHKIAR
jgi:outer membrane protein assembly factor BamB